MSLLAAVIVGAAWGIINVHSVDDWLRLRNYTPPAAIASLADQDTFTSYTRHMFYVNHPQLINTVDTFRQYCPENKETIVLGCYHPGQNGIYIYSVNDPALYGVEQVTAAHEVLHAVYERLSTKQRNQLNAELEDYYKNGLTDPRVKAEVVLYQQTEPTDVMDEMSCTFGTEIANLPPALEEYYQQYFSNRQAIVAFEQNYQAEFTSRQSQINADDARLAVLKAQIGAEEDSLKSQLSDLQAGRSSVENSNDQAQINSYNSQVAAYNSGVSRLQADISTYNALVAQRNAIASDLASLQNSLDTRLTTQAKQQ